MMALSVMRNLLGTNFRAALRDIAIAEAKLILEQASAVLSRRAEHFETGNANEETWAGKTVPFVVFAKNVTNVFGRGSIDAFAKLLDAIDIQLGNFPFHSLAGLEGRDFAVDTIVPGNVVTRSLMRGSFIGRT